MSGRDSSASDTELSKLLLGHHDNYNSTSSRFKSSVVSFHNLSYSVKVKENRKKVDKVILHDVSGIFKPGLNAIMGPSGSGKTTLLDILSCSKEPKGLSGMVLIDGALPHPNFNRMSGYVQQDDTVMGILTVRENLTFCAALRLPGHLTKKQRQRRVNDVIAELDLEDCADTKVGTIYERGISGGERKRTCVGMELIVGPNILFLDEPTTGLDASTAMTVIQLLAKLSTRGYTIIFTIHQPRFGIFRLFNSLHLLSKGRTVYCGAAEECMQYFDSFGYECAKYDNPADHFLDVILQNEAEDSLCSPQRTSESHLNPASLVTHYRQSAYYQRMLGETGTIFDNYSTSLSTQIVQEINYPTSWFIQFRWLCWRTSSNLFGNPIVVKSLYLLPLFVTLLTGIIYIAKDSSRTSDIQDRLGAIFIYAVNTMRFAIISMQVFLDDKVTFRHEATRGYYRISAYFLSQVIGYDIPSRLIPLICITPIYYFMIGFRLGVVPFFKFMLSILLAAFSVGSMAFLIAVNTNSFALANVIFAVAFLLQILFAGILINVFSIIPWLQFLQYASIARYAVNAACIIEFKDREFCDPYPNNNTCSAGNDYLEGAGIDFSEWGYWQTQVAMVIITLVFWALTYISLRLMPKTK